MSNRAPVEQASARPPATVTRRLPIGAEILPDAHGVHFRVWAPARQRVAVIIDGVATPLAREVSDADADAVADAVDAGYFSGIVSNARAGTRYQFRLDEDDLLLPDPASRSQPDGPHGPSVVVDPTAFAWTDRDWRGCPLEGQVLYELHVGTFTPEGTLRAAMGELDELKDLGITVIELMPLSEFPGRFGWGYDGVDWFAPTRLYGEPDDLRAFIDRAHALGMGVILDVVYNHFGPDGNYLTQFSRDYLTDRYGNEWGSAINYDGPNSGPVREFVLANVRYWIEEFHFDGYRLDATQQIFDTSEDHILTALSRTARSAAGDRQVLLMAENEAQDAWLMRLPDASKGVRGGGLDAMWNDDYHHSAVVAVTGRSEAYYSDYRGTPQELLACAKWGFLFQGQYYSWQKQARGEPALDCAPAKFVCFVENHDQVANSARGWRLHQQTSPGRFRAITALTLLLPGTPLLFQGQEFASSKPFLFFADHQDELARAVRKGRADFLSQFPRYATPEVRAILADPGDPQTFNLCKLDFAERDLHHGIYQLHRDLLKMRRETPAFRAQAPKSLDGASLGPEALLLRFFHAEGDRLLLLNLGPELRLKSCNSPLMAPPAGQTWELTWSSDAPQYGGDGTAPLNPADLRLPPHALLVLEPTSQHPSP
jgi:maltooligosyltrehalose trehalohydrolase